MKDEIPNEIGNENTDAIEKLALSFASIFWFSRRRVEGDVKSCLLSFRRPCRARWLGRLTSGPKNQQPFLHICVNKLECIFLCWSPRERASVQLGSS